MMIFLGFIAAVAVLFLLYLFVLVRPAAKIPPDRRLLCDYAHRGLHGEGVPENSLKAFRLAAEAGYGIELDIQLSSDREVMVFHDYTLCRMTGREGKLSEFTSDELSKLSLDGTDEHIPRFREVLELVDGKVPLLVELKGEDFSTELCVRAAELLLEYDGTYCVESFNPILLGKMAKLLPMVYRGILFTNVAKDKKRTTPLNLILSYMASNVIARPNFIACNEVYRNSLAAKICTGFYKAKCFTWTHKTRESYDKAKRNGEYAIFEDFMP